jgi:IS30 family transposase
MANKTISHMEMKQILRLKSNGMSILQISRELGLHQKTVTEYIKLCETKGISYDKVVDLGDTQIIAKMIRGENLIKEDCKEKLRAKDLYPRHKQSSYVIINFCIRNQL